MTVHQQGRPRISVVVPVYNTEPYLEAAIESLLRQTEPFHEIIAVNDGSTDGSIEVLRRYERQGLVRVMEQGNLGQGPARNLGARHATGDWIYFFDSDDLASPHLVETVRRQSAFAAGKLQAILFSGDPFLDPGVDPQILQRTPPYKRPQLGRFQSFHDATIALETFAASYVSPCLYVLSTELVRTKALCFPAGYHEDDNFYLDLVAHACETHVLAEVLFRRRIRSGSVTTSPKSMKHVRGYLAASARARRHSGRQEDAARQQYFRRRAIEYYLQAMALARGVQGPNPYRWLPARLLAMPTWKLTLRQYAAVLSGGRSGARSA